MKIPGEGSHCVASDPTPTKATTARKEAIGVEERIATCVTTKTTVKDDNFRDESRESVLQVV